MISSPQVFRLKCINFLSVPRILSQSAHPTSFLRHYIEKMALRIFNSMRRVLSHVGLKLKQPMVAISYAVLDKM